MATITELKQAVAAAQAAWNADTARIKRMAASDRVINEGGEGYSSAEAASEASANKHYAIVKAAKDALLAAEWTPEVFAARRAIWNTEVAKTKSYGDLAKLQTRLGYGMDQLRDAKKILGL